MTSVSMCIQCAYQKIEVPVSLKFAVMDFSIPTVLMTTPVTHYSSSHSVVSVLPIYLLLTTPTKTTRPTMVKT